MAEINWEEPYCGEGNNCFRLGTDHEATRSSPSSARRIVTSPTAAKPSSR